jgi:tetratricopeptide (TPR) repeat protein
MDIDQQAAVRRAAEEQSSALNSMTSWLGAVAQKEAEMLSRPRAAARGPRGPSAAAPLPLAPPTAAGAPVCDPIEALHEEGNAAMAAGQFSRAAGLYTRVLCARQGHVAALANRSLAFLKLGQHRSCVADATLALRLNPTHVKSWLRRAAAREALGQHSLAARDLSVVLALEPGNRGALQELRKTSESIKAAQRRAPEVQLRVVEKEEDAALE